MPFLFSDVVAMVSDMVPKPIVDTTVDLVTPENPSVGDDATSQPIVDAIVDLVSPNTSLGGK